MALYRHTVLGTNPGETWSFRLYSEGTPSLSTAQTTWVAAFGAFWSTNVAKAYATSIHAVEATTAEIDVATGKQLMKLATPLDQVGTSEATSCPFQVAAVVSFRTGLATRAGRGRIYAPSPAVDQIADGRLTAAYTEALADGAQAMLNGLSGGALTPILYTRGSANRIITSLDVGDVPDTQRRRRNKLIEARTSRVVG